jgi:hypothetical protein
MRKFEIANYGSQRFERRAKQFKYLINRIIYNIFGLL